MVKQERLLADIFCLTAIDLAYDKAKAVLEQRYGSSFAITEAFRDKLDAWPKIQARDGKGLRRLSDFLNQCESAMTAIPGLCLYTNLRCV